MTSHPAEAATREIAPYGHCPTCHAKGVSRERRPDGNDKCENGHIYPSRNALCFLSTHQQQGAESAQAALDREFDKAMKEPNQRLSDFEVLWNVAVSLLSRAPQPDTVTDRLRDLLEWADEYCRTGKCPTYDAVEPARAALTAALNAKGK